MAKSKKGRRRGLDIDRVLKGWEYEPGTVSARLVETSAGRQVLQMRIDMGVLQMEVVGRPDGTSPGGAETYYDYLVAEAIFEGDDFELDEDQCAEIDREFMQFYHRRICWLSLREFRRAIEDADHNLALMEFARQSCDDEEWLASHEQFRPFVLFHRTYAAAMAELEDDRPAEAIDQINRGLDRMAAVFEEYDAEEHFDDDELVNQLTGFRESLREHFEVGQTLNEQLAHAIANEQYELAAQLRDKLDGGED